MESPQIQAAQHSLLLPAVAAGLFAVVWYAALLLRWRRRGSPPLPPGPPGLPLVGSLPFLDPELHTYFARLATAHGPIFRLRLGAKLGVVVTSPDLARAVLREQDPAFANRDVPAAARVIAYGGADVAWTPLGPTWRTLRGACVRGMLGPARLDAELALRRREVRAAVRHLRARAGEPVDVGAHMFLTAMNVITSTLWGGTVEGDGEITAVGKEFRELVSEITVLLGRANVSDFFPALARFDLQGVEKQMRVLLDRFEGIFAAIIEQRRKRGEGGGEKDFLEYVLKMEAEGGESKTPFTMTHVKALLMDMVVGGTETTSNTVEWTMAEMLKKPEILKRAQEELDRVVGPHAAVEESHLPRLPYLWAVIKEALRLHPALPLLIPHCPSSTCVVGGYTIPRGSRVFVNVWAIHRDPSVWEQPLEFRPERFLDADDGRWDFSGGDFRYFPFGSGRRICAGISMAERMVAGSLASLLHAFDWRLPEGAELDLAEKFGIVLKKAEPLVAVPTPRLPDPDLY